MQKRTESQTTDLEKLTEQVKRLCDILEKGIQVKNDGLHPIPSSVMVYKQDKNIQRQFQGY